MDKQIKPFHCCGAGMIFVTSDDVIERKGYGEAPASILLQLAMLHTK